MDDAPDVTVAGLDPGRQYIVFVNQDCVDAGLLQAIQDEAVGGKVLVMPVKVPLGQTVSDVVVVTRLDRLEAEDEDC